MRLVAWLLSTVSLAGGASAFAATVVLSPGPGVIQAAIDAAQPGDRIRLCAGLGLCNEVYTEAIVVTKPLTIEDGRCYADRRGYPCALARIDAGCGGSPAITVAADHVRLTGLVVGGASGPYGIDIRDRTDVRLRRMHVGYLMPSQCLPTDACINVERSRDVKMRETDACAWSPATTSYGIRLAEIAVDARVSLMRTSAGYGTQGGLLIENSGANAPLGRSRILLNQGAFFANGVGGVLLRAADGVKILNARAGGAQSIVLDAFSDNNYITNTTLEAPAVDDGTGNCWRHNNPEVFGCP